MKDLKKNNIERQAAVIPPVICKVAGGDKLSLFRVKSEDNEGYILESSNKTLFTLQPWEFHVLNALFAFGGNEYKTLLENANDRFGLSLSQVDIEQLFERLRQDKLLDKNEALKHPLTKPFCYEGATKEAYKLKATNTNVANQNNNNLSEKQNLSSHVKELVNEIKSIPHKLKQFKQQLINEANDNSEAEDDIEATPTRGLREVHLFDPTSLLHKHRTIFTTAKYLAYPIPLLLFSAIFILMRHTPVVENDFAHLFGGFKIVGHIIFGLFTVNIVSLTARVAVAHAYTATVNSISVIWIFGFIPRFIAKFDDADKLTRRQKLWFQATPLISRLGLFSLGVFIWYHNRHLGGLIPQFGTMLAFVSAASFLLVSCPFLKNNGYRFLAELLREPNLRGKSIKALLNIIHKNHHTQSYSRSLAAYALTCLAFTLGLISAIIMLIYNGLNVEIGTGAVFVICAVMSLIGFRLWKKIKQINEAYKQNMQFERWRERTLPTEIQDAEPVKKEEDIRKYYTKKLALISLCLFLLIPYPYRPSGKIVLLPVAQQQISTDIEGIVDEVYFDGGEFLEKDTLIAKLSVSDYEAQLKIQEAKLAEQQAIIDHLISKPTEEELAIAEEKLGVATIQYSYSQEKCNRQRELFKSGSISLEEMAEVEKICETDKQQVLKAEAELNRVISGTPEAEIAAGKAALLPIQAEITMYQDKIKRSEFRMPFDGSLGTLYLKERKGKFLAKGEPLAQAGDNTSYKAIMEVPETDLPFIKYGAKVEVRTMAYPGRKFNGSVKEVEPDIENAANGRMLRMVVQLEQDKELLKSGMTGYAKVEGESIAAWKILTRAIYRFVNVELWAWTS